MRVVAGVADVDDVDAFVERLDVIGDEYGCAVQAFDADYVADRAHLAAAVERANRAFDRGENVASERAVEILLYAAGRRQIRQALEMGVDEGESEVVVVVDGEDETSAVDAVADLLAETLPFAGETGPLAGDGKTFAGDQGVLAGDEEAFVGDETTLRAFFDVGDAEAAVVDDLSEVVRERVALLDVEK